MHFSSCLIGQNFITWSRKPTYWPGEWFYHYWLKVVLTNQDTPGLELRGLVEEGENLEQTCVSVERRERARMDSVRHPGAPRAYSNSHSSSQWCPPTISSSAIRFSSCFNLSQNQGLFQWVSSSPKYWSFSFVCLFCPKTKRNAIGQNKHFYR